MTTQVENKANDKRAEAKKLQAEAKKLQAEAKRLREDAVELEHPPDKQLLTCRVCGKEGESWSAGNDLSDCCPYIRPDNNDKIVTLLFGFVHRECRQGHWEAEIERAVARGWLEPIGDGRYRPTR